LNFISAAPRKLSLSKRLQQSLQPPNLGNEYRRHG